MSMNALVYADLDERDTRMGSSIASTIQQMSFVLLGLLTAVSALVLRDLRAEDGLNVSRHLPVTNDSLAVAGVSSHEEVSGRADPDVEPRSAAFEPLGQAAVDCRCGGLGRRPPDYAPLPDFRNLVTAGPKALNRAYVRFCSDLRPIRYPPKSDIKPRRSPLPIVHRLSTAPEKAAEGGRRGVNG
jgi:hypothetical protein